MSKSMLVMDTPENCVKCSLYHYPSCRCYVTEKFQNNISEDYKPDWCPLQEVPKKKPYNGEDGITGSSLPKKSWKSIFSRISFLFCSSRREKRF